MKTRIFIDSKSIEEKKKLLLKEVESHLDIESDLTKYEIQTLNSIDNNDYKLNNLLNQADKSIPSRTISTTKIKLLLGTIIIYKKYPAIIKDYSNQSIIVLATRYCTNTNIDNFESELRECSSRYNDDFLKEIYNRHKSTDYIIEQFDIMSMIYDLFLANSENNKTLKNTKLKEIYSLISDKKFMDMSFEKYKNIGNYLKNRSDKK